MKLKNKKILKNTGIVLGILAAIIVILLIVKFGFLASFISGTGDVYDSDWYSIGQYSITLNAKTVNNQVLPASSWGADLTDNRIQRYDQIWKNQGKILNPSCSISFYLTNPATGQNRNVNTIGEAKNVNGILLCKLVYIDNIGGHYKDTFNNPAIKWTFINFVCETKQEKCEGITSFLCKNNAWVDQGIILNSCGVDCISDSDCLSNQTCELYKCKAIEINEPITPPAPESKGILNSIKSWLLRVFEAWASLFKQQIFGQEVVQPGSLQTYNISLTTTKPDLDFSDGKYQVQYANWILIDKNENIIKEGQWKEIDGIYSTKATFTVPSKLDNHLLIAMIVQYDMEYDFNSKEWIIVKEEVLENEAFGIKTSIAQPIKPTPQIGNFFKNIINSIVDLFKNLFKK